MQTKITKQYLKKLFDFQNLVYSHIDKRKKTVAFFNHLGNYNSHFGSLHKYFKKNNFNVINLKTIFTKPDNKFDSLAPTFILPNITNEGIISSAELDFIDLVIGANATDKNLVSFHAKGLYLSHDVLHGIIPSSTVKYVYIGSKIAIENILKNHKEEAKGHCLITGGYPRLDNAIKKYKKFKNLYKPTAILYAPTTRFPKNMDKSHMNYNLGYDYHIIQMLLDNFDLDVIYRNHPIDYMFNREMINILKEKFKHNKRVIFSDGNVIEAQIRAKLLITDISDTAFTFSFTTLKPSIFITPGYKTIQDLVTPIDKIGFEVKTLNEVCEKTEYILKNNNFLKKQIKTFRDENIFNVGKSEQYLIDNIDYILKDKQHPNWIYM